MTQREKAEMLKETIRFLYENESRGKVYISNLLEIDRRVLTYAIKEWGLVKGTERHLKPSSQKFLNAHRKEIMDMLDTDGVQMIDIAEKFGISVKSLHSTYINNDKELLHHYNMRVQRHEDKKLAHQAKREERICVSLEGELWNDVMGFPGYQISNFGRVRRWDSSLLNYRTVNAFNNKNNNRVYVMMYREEEKKKNLQVARLVGFSFVEGYSEERNTINHKDGDVTNNRADNLEWVSQRDNNIHSYKELNRQPSISYSKHGKFKKIILNDKYEFKTIVALAKFLNLSPSGLSYHIERGEKSPYKIEFVC